MNNIVNRITWPLVTAMLWIVLMLSRTFLFPMFWRELYAAAVLERATMLFNSNLPKESIGYYQKAIEYGADFEIEIACQKLGKIYEEGLGVEKDIQKAEEFYSRVGV